MPKGIVAIDLVSQMHLSPSGKNINTITLDNLPGEMLTDIRALADLFLIALPNINRSLAAQAEWGPAPKPGRGRASRNLCPRP